jgi:hypothetical protein
MSRFIINQISGSDSQNIKLNGCPQIPIILAIPGAVSIRNNPDPYTVKIGDKEI